MLRECPVEYSEMISFIREKILVSQKKLAEILSVSFVFVNS